MKNYVIINGTNSNTITGLMINELPPITKPPLRVLTEEIDGRDGDITTNLGYGAYDKTITIGLWGNSYDINSIISFFNGEGTIVFSNESDKYYNFKIISQIDYERLLKFKTASITFHCQPFKYPLSLTPKSIAYTYIEDSGTSLTINNTASSTMQVNLLGNTSQTGTPTPDSPIPVNVVSGDNTIKVEGKNLVNFGTQNFTTYKDYTGLFFPAGTYTFSAKVTSSDTSQTVSRVYFYGESGGTNQVFINLSRNTRANATITTTFDIKRIVLYSSIDYASSNGKTATYENIQLERSSTATDYEPYQSQTYPINLGTIELCKIGTYQDYFTKNSGKNLFDKENATNGYRLGSDGTPYADNSYVLSNYIKVLSSTQYAYSSGRTFGGSSAVCFYDSNKTFISRTTPITASITTPNNASYVRITDVLLAKDKMQFEKGSQATPYEPYGTGQWCKYNAIGKVVLDGSENWSDFFSTTGFYKAAPTTPALNETGTINGISNYYQCTTRNEIRGLSSSANNKCSIYSSELVLVNTSITTINDFKTWLSTHNTIVYYILATPYLSLIEDTNLIEQLDNLQNAMSYKGTTNIGQVNNDLPFLLDLKVLELGSDEAVINNTGNVYSKPLIALEGTGIVNVYLNDNQIFQVDMTDNNKINIDIEKLEAYNPDDNTLMNRKITGDISKFIFNPGNNTVKIDGLLTKATISNFVRWL